jgi:hypothetical protein
MNLETVRAVLLAAIAKIASKESRRELLVEGKAHQVDLRISGTVDGETFKGEKFGGILTVGHESTQSKSSAAPPNEVVAYFLGAMSAAARKRLLAELPRQFLDAGGKLPEIDEDRLTEAKTLLERLRSRVDQAVAAPITWSFAK